MALGALANIGKIPELRRRLLFTLGMVAVYRVGVFVTTPGVNRSVMRDIVGGSDSSLLGMFNLFSGGALEQLSIFALGIMPYITSSIILQILGVVVPDHLQRMNAAKNLLALVVNVVAAVTYTLVAFDRIDWSAAAAIAVGSLVGGFIGARYGRRLSPPALRAVIVLVGLIGLWRLLA